MGKLIRTFDWSKTPVGPIHSWSHSLKTMVGVVLHSGFPMFLWWGEEMVQFYNDAYRPSLGDDGKHPKALGQKAIECWPEIWSIIFPLIQNVRKTGQSFLAEDQLIPIFRNGKIEDVYWTFTYSPVIDETEKIGGVLVTCIETTEKVSYLKALKENKEQLLFAIEATELGVWDYNPVTNKFSGNARLKEWFGLPAQDDLDLTLALNSIAAHDRNRVWEAIQSALQYSSGGNYDVNYTIIHPVNKSERFVHAKGKAHFDTNHKGYRLNGTLQDITSSEMSRRGLERSEASLRNIILNAPVAMCIFKGSNHIVEIANQKMFQLWGKAGSDVIPEINGQGYDDLIKTFTTGEAFAANELPVTLRRNGKSENIFVNFVYEPIRNPDGTVSGIIVVAVEVTQQVQARKAVEHSEKLLRNLVLNAPIGICVMDSPSRISKIVNDKFLEVAGKSRDSIIGKYFWDTFAEARPRYESMLTDVVENGVSHYANDVEVKRIRDGKEQSIFITVVYEPLKDPNDDVSKVVVWIVETTHQMLARRKVEQIVNERTKELELANQALTKSNLELHQFAYIASHDLQEPARKLRTFSNMLQSHLQDTDERTKNYLEKIDRSSARMLQLIRDILSFSRLEKETQDFCQVDLNEILSSVKEDFELLIVEKGASIESVPLPQVYGIKIQMAQLFGNLISNSLKFYVPDRRPQINIAVAAMLKNEVLHNRNLNPEIDYLRISVTDNGIGFNQSNAIQIFDLFNRLNPKNEYEGTGIGLPMCKKICANHGGDIYAESMPGEGATFHIVLPR